MRILYILHQFYPEFSGGTERVALNLARSAQRAGHSVRVLACGVKPGHVLGRPSAELKGALEYVYQGVSVLLLPHSKLPVAGDFSFEVNQEAVELLAEWMKVARFDVAHVLHSMRMGSAILAAQRCALPYVITLTDFFAACYRINLVNMRNEMCSGPRQGDACSRDCLAAPWDAGSLSGRYRQASAFLAAAGERVVPSEYVARSFRHSFADLDFRVVPHGIDFLGFSTGTRSVAQGRGGSPNITFGYLGSIVRQKGLDTLLNAFAQVPDSRLRLRIIGGFYGDPVYEADIRRLIAADTRVELVGQVPPEDVFEVLSSLDVLCLPSRVPETFSLSLNEAAAANVPALVSDLGAPGERVRSIGGGRAVAPDDVNAWAAAIRDIASYPGQIKTWQSELPLPLRLEEEAFFYESLYRRLIKAA